MKFTKLLLLLLVVFAMAFTGCMKSGGGKITKKKKKPSSNDPLAGMEFDDTAKSELTMSSVSAIFEKKGWEKTTAKDGKNYPGELVYKTDSAPNKLRLKLMKKDHDTSDKLNTIQIEIFGAVSTINSAEQIDTKIKDALNAISKDFLPGLDKAISSYRKIEQPGHPRNTGKVLSANGWECSVVNYIGSPDKGVAAKVIVGRPFNPMD